jgi:hypothetical protein
MSKRARVPLLTDFLPSEILNNEYFKNNIFRFSSSVTVAEQADLLVITFLQTVLYIARTGMLEDALLTITKALIGGAEGHVAKHLDGYFSLLKTFGYRLYKTNAEVTSRRKAEVTGGPILTAQQYGLRRIDRNKRKYDDELDKLGGSIDIENDNSAPPLPQNTEGELHEWSGITMELLVTYWYNQSFHLDDTAFNIGDFVNALCGAVATSYLQSKDARIYDTPSTSPGASRESPLVIQRKCGKMPDLPPLHLLRI